jgi:hypothetical protein
LGKGIWGVVLLFVMGVFVGGAGTFYFEKHQLERAFRGPKEFSFFLVERISRKLDLDQAQREKLVEIVRRSRRELHAIRLQAAPQAEKVFLESEKDIQAILNEKQRMKFNRMIERRKRFFEEMRKED